MKITFLGTNGWYDSATGNTPSILIDTKDCYIVLDAGFGFAKLNNYLKEDKPIYLFLSHFHLDHTCGLHTLPMLGKNIRLTILGQRKTKKYLNILIRHPFSASFSDFGYKVKIVELKPGVHHLPFETFCLPLKHADPALGYRFNIEGKIITYCSDTGICPNDLELAKGADILVHECGFAVGIVDTWGHTNPEESAQLAKDAGVKKLILTHLGANYFDSGEKRQQAEAVAKVIFPATTVAWDGMEVDV